MYTVTFRETLGYGCSVHVLSFDAPSFLLSWLRLQASPSVFVPSSDPLARIDRRPPALALEPDSDSDSDYSHPQAGR